MKCARVAKALLRLVLLVSLGCTEVKESPNSVTGIDAAKIERVGVWMAVRGDTFYHDGAAKWIDRGGIGPKERSVPAPVRLTFGVYSLSDAPQPDGRIDPVIWGNVAKEWSWRVWASRDETDYRSPAPTAVTPWQEIRSSAGDPGFELLIDDFLCQYVVWRVEATYEDPNSDAVRIPEPTSATLFGALFQAPCADTSGPAVTPLLSE